MPTNPLHLTLRSRRTALTQHGKKYMQSIADTVSGHHRFDYVSASAKHIYRCPSPERITKYGPQSQPVNSSGLQRKLQSHIEQCHCELSQNIALEGRMANGRIRNFFLHPPSTKTRASRRRPQEIPSNAEEAGGNLKQRKIPRPQDLPPILPCFADLLSQSSQRFPPSTRRTQDQGEDSNDSLSFDERNRASDEREMETVKDETPKPPGQTNAPSSKPAKDPKDSKAADERTPLSKGPNPDQKLDFAHNLHPNE